MALAEVAVAVVVEAAPPEYPHRNACAIPRFELSALTELKLLVIAAVACVEGRYACTPLSFIYTSRQLAPCVSRPADTTITHKV